MIPAELISTLSDTEFEGVIAHELAHIKRWDYLTNILQRFIQAYLFFHPAVWLIGRYLIVERELACDDWAVKVTGEPHRYATCLTRLVEELRGSKPLAIATGIFFGKHIISRRVEMILDNNRNSSTFIAKPALLYALSMAIVCIGVCSLLSPVIAVPAGQVQAMMAQTSTPPAPKPTTTDTKAPAKSPVATETDNQERRVAAAAPVASPAPDPIEVAIGIADQNHEFATPAPMAQLAPFAQPAGFAQATPFAVLASQDMMRQTELAPLAAVAYEPMGISFVQQKAATAASGEKALTGNL